MRHEKFTACTKCGAPLGKGNTSGHCRRCSMRETVRRRRQDDAELAKLVQACDRAGWAVKGRLRNALNEEKRRTDIAFARELGTALTARLSLVLTPEQLDRVWRTEQHRSQLPPLALEAASGRVCLRFCNEFYQNHSAAEIRSHFETAVRTECPDLTVEWIDE